MAHVLFLDRSIHDIDIIALTITLSKGERISTEYGDNYFLHNRDARIQVNSCLCACTSV